LERDGAFLIQESTGSPVISQVTGQDSQPQEYPPDLVLVLQCPSKCQSLFPHRPSFRIAATCSGDPPQPVKSGCRAPGIVRFTTEGKTLLKQGAGGLEISGEVHIHLSGADKQSGS